MANLGKIVYLSEAQLQTLLSSGSITSNGTTVVYSENDLYITPDAGNILVSPNGTRYRLKVANDGTLSTEAVS